MVQFTVGRLLGLRVDADGVATVNEKGVQLTFNERGQEHKLWDAATETVLVPWAEIASWEVIYGLFGDQIRMQVDSVAAFGALPGIDGNDLQLDIRKQHREALKDFEKRGQE